MTKLSELIPDEHNANKGTARGAAQLETSLRKYGAGRSILIDRNGRIIAGNKTVENAAAIGLDDVVVVETDGTKLVAVKRTDLDLTDDSTGARELAYADNRVAEVGLQWDAEAVFADFEAGIELGDFFKDEELADLLGDLMTTDEGKDTEPQIDRAEELRQKLGVETGQLWQLGEHRLICGDCTDADVVARVMEGEKIKLVATSPPYSDMREYNIGNFDWDKLMFGFSDVTFPLLADNSSAVINLGQKHTDGEVDFYWDKWLAHCKKSGFPLFGLYVWVKNKGLPGNWNGRCMPAHEFIFHFSKGQIQANKWVKTKTKASKGTFRQKDGTINDASSPHLFGQEYRIPYSVFNAMVQPSTSTAEDEHPARFSEDFVSQLIKTWSNEGETVYEPFSGSGTTIIACENLGRKCRAVEIDPGYVAVALERWAEHTGKTPELIG